MIASIEMIEFAYSRSKKYSELSKKKSRGQGLSLEDP